MRTGDSAICTADQVFIPAGKVVLSTKRSITVRRISVTALSQGVIVSLQEEKTQFVTSFS